VDIRFGKEVIAQILFSAQYSPSKVQNATWSPKAFCDAYFDKMVVFAAV
jgi:hypothetical protein